MHPIKITRIYHSLDDTSAQWITFRMPSGTTTDILIDMPHYRKLMGLLKQEGFKVQYEKDADGYMRTESMVLE